MDKPMQTSCVAMSEIVTPHASKYLQQLCKHFAHRHPVTFDAQSGQIAFSSGDCRLAARAGALALWLEAHDNEHLVQLEDVVARHLVRFAFSETLQIAFVRPRGES